MKKNYAVMRTIIIVFILVLGSINVYGSNKIMIQGVPTINQYPELPTGCEATALTMLLQYYGINVTKQDVAMAMPKAAVPTYQNGKKYGESPNNAFIGNPFSKNSYGVYAPVILKMIEDYLPGRAEDLGGGSFDKVYQALDEGRPVMIWTTIGMLEAEYGDRWTTPTGEVVNWQIPEHAVVAVGYDNQHIYLNDPYTGKQRKYTKDLVLNRWVSMGSQAVAVKKTNAYPYTEMIEQRHILVDGITYKNLLRVDQHGKWIKAVALSSIYPQTKVQYDAKVGKVKIEIREDYRMPTDTGKGMVPNREGKLEAIPRNLNGKYYINIQLSPMEKEIITYNSKAKRIDMTYKIVDGTTYVSLDWVRKFYDKDIIELK